MAVVVRCNSSRQYLRFIDSDFDAMSYISHTSVSRQKFTTI